MDDERNTPQDPNQEAEMVVLGSLVKTRAEQAYELKVAGKTLSAIADELGYRSDVEVAHALRERFEFEARYFSESGRSSMIQLELARLERLHAAYYPSAIAGDREDAKVVLSAMDRRIKLGQLDAVDTATQGATVLVISGEEQSYVQKLKSISDE